MHARRPVLAALLCAASQFLLTTLILVVGKHFAPPAAFGRVKLIAFASTIVLPIALAQAFGLWRRLGFDRAAPTAFFFVSLVPAAMFVVPGLHFAPGFGGEVVIQIFNAFGEELLFRGVVFALLIGLPRGRSIVLNGVLFGSMHLLHGFMDGNWVGALQWAAFTAVAGMMFTAVRYETGSLWLVMALHLVLNLCKLSSNLEAAFGPTVLLVVQRAANVFELGLAAWAMARGGSEERAQSPAVMLRSA